MRGTINVSSYLDFRPIVNIWDDTSNDCLNVGMESTAGPMTPVSRQRLNSIASRWAALTVSTWGGILGLFVPTSLVFKLHDRFDVLDWINGGALAICALGYADVIWHDIRGRLIWPSLDPHVRHRACVLVYSALGAVWLLKAFASAASTGMIRGAVPMAVFAVFMASICGLTAVAIALEER